MSDCGRIPYASRAMAQRAARQVGGQKVYSCGKCGQWHLSSKTPAEIKRARKRGGYGLCPRCGLDHYGPCEYRG